MIKRAYRKDYSSYLQKDMELLIFGDGGRPVIFFPTRTARFYDYEDWKVIDALKHRIDAREIQVICIDSNDNESFYNQNIQPSERIARHGLFEKYILFEVMALIKQINPNPHFISAGCSLGAYHAFNIAFRHPHLFKKVVGMSGRYDLTIDLPFFADLFDGFRNQDIYFNMPSQFIPNVESIQLIRLLKKLDIIIAIGKEDVFLQNNIEMHIALTQKGIEHQFHTWDGEAHKAQYWRQMVVQYL